MESKNTDIYRQFKSRYFLPAAEFGAGLGSLGNVDGNVFLALCFRFTQIIELHSRRPKKLSAAQCEEWLNMTSLDEFKEFQCHIDDPDLLVDGERCLYQGMPVILHRQASQCKLTTSSNTITLTPMELKKCTFSSSFSLEDRNSLRLWNDTKASMTNMTSTQNGPKRFHTEALRTAYNAVKANQAISEDLEIDNQINKLKHSGLIIEQIMYNGVLNDDQKNFLSAVRQRQQTLVELWPAKNKRIAKRKHVRPHVILSSQFICYLLTNLTRTARK